MEAFFNGLYRGDAEKIVRQHGMNWMARRSISPIYVALDHKAADQQHFKILSPTDVIRMLNEQRYQLQLSPITGFVVRNGAPTIEPQQTLGVPFSNDVVSIARNDQRAILSEVISTGFEIRQHLDVMNFEEDVVQPLLTNAQTK